MNPQKKYQIAVIPGDGIGPEVVAQGMRVLETVAKLCDFSLKAVQFPWSGKHYLKTGEILPENAIFELKKFDAIYFGAIGDPRIPVGILEHGILLRIRRELDLYANLRPLKLYHSRYSPLKRDALFDILVVRENTEDLYFGPSGVLHGGTPEETAVAMAFYSRKGIERIVRYAFQMAQKRKKKLTLCDKANAVRAQELWRKIFSEVGKEYPDVEQEFFYVDACAMAFVRRPENFDVVVTTNVFGDILSDLGAELCGGIGLAPSGNINPGRQGMFEPIHGSAPKYAGRNKANPIGAILAASLMLNFLGEKEGETVIEKTVEKVLQSGKMDSLGTRGNLGTIEIADFILESLNSEFLMKKGKS